MGVLGQNLLALLSNFMIFYFFGYGLMSDAEGGIMGEAYQSLSVKNDKTLLRWIFKAMVIQITSVILSGSVVERMHLSSFFILNFLMTCSVFPISSSWVLGRGWLYSIDFMDAAGSSFIHAVGGLCGLVATVFLGPRHGVFDTHI